jgi:hypothetical protein
MRRTILMVAAATWLLAMAADAQESPRVRAERILPAEVFRDLSVLAEEMTADGISDEPLYLKAVEGAAKNVPPAMLLPGVRAYATRLRGARQAFGAGAPTTLLRAGADALQRGVSPEALRALPADRLRSPMAILVLTDLMEAGVPADRALDILRDAMQQRAQDDRMLDISARVRRLIRQGLTPQEAIDRVRRNLQRARDGADGPPVPPGSEPATGDRVLDGRSPG